jgi:basic membrane protein A
MALAPAVLITAAMSLVACDEAGKEAEPKASSQMVKVGIAYDVGQYADGTVSDGVMEFGLDTDGVDFSTSGGKIDDVLPRLAELKQKLIDGSIVAPTDPPSGG